MSWSTPLCTSSQCCSGCFFFKKKVWLHLIFSKLVVSTCSNCHSESTASQPWNWKDQNVSGDIIIQDTSTGNRARCFVHIKEAPDPAESAASLSSQSAAVCGTARWICVWVSCVRTRLPRGQGQIPQDGSSQLQGLLLCALTSPPQRPASRQNHPAAGQFSGVWDSSNDLQLLTESRVPTVECSKVSLDIDFALQVGA